MILRLLSWPSAVLALLAACWWLSMTKDEAVQGRETDRARYVAAQAEASALASAARLKKEEEYRNAAHESDVAHLEAMRGLRDYADRAIALGRLRAKTLAGGTGQTVASAQGGDSKVPEGMPADPIVVAARDVQICTDAVGYGVSAHNWAVKMDSRPTE